MSDAIKYATETLAPLEKERGGDWRIVPIAKEQSLPSPFPQSALVQAQSSSGRLRGQPPPPQDEVGGGGVHARQGQEGEEGGRTTPLEHAGRQEVGAQCGEARVEEEEGCEGRDESVGAVPTSTCASSHQPNKNAEVRKSKSRDKQWKQYRTLAIAVGLEMQSVVAEAEAEAPAAEAEAEAEAQNTHVEMEAMPTTTTPTAAAATKTAKPTECIRTEAIERVEARFRSNKYSSLAAFVLDLKKTHKGVFKHAYDGDALVRQVLMM